MEINLRIARIMDNTGFIFFFVPLLFGLFTASSAQYSTDEIDPVNGALLAECVFYGDQTVDCNGRLRCHPNDVQARSTSSMLDRTCPREANQKTGTWDANQVIPSSMTRNAGSGRVAKCLFYASNNQGQFTCTGTQGDSWKGKYTGTMNAAFKLGLPIIQSTYPGGSSWTHHSPAAGSVYPGSGSSSSYPAGSVYGNNNAAGSVYPSGSVYGSRDPYNVNNRPIDSDYYTTTRYSVYGGRDRDNNYNDGGLNIRPVSDRDRYPGSGGTMLSQTIDGDRDAGNNGRTTTNDIVMCTYQNDGSGRCRDCTERVTVVRSDTNNERYTRTTKHYTCQAPDRTSSWERGSELVPTGSRPDLYASRKQSLSTCIFHPTERSFACYAGNGDGSCDLTSRRDTTGSDGYGSSSSRTTDISSQLANCLTGNKWTGTYSGRI